MYVYKLKVLAGRSLALAAASSLMAVVGISAVFPALSYADALNPLTERTLLLSSSAPGDHFLDAAGNTTYAQPNTGPNGKQTGETFSFRVSTNSSNSGFGAKNTPIKAFTFQYCTSAAGICKAPGDGSVNLNIHYGTGAIANTFPGTSTDVAGTTPVQGTDFDIYTGDGKTLVPYDPAHPWTMTVANHQEGATGPLTTDNFITLSNPDSTMQPAAGTLYTIVFRASASNYITNPKSGAFFVRINDYDSDLDADHVPTTETHIIDGGVTVANVMTDSIQISTKVLETMAFSVGTVNPDTVDPTNGGQNSNTHGPCDDITVNDPLKIGDPDQEYALAVKTAYDTHSYWRLSSNSSNGASVYYSGYTLSNTENDQIDEMTVANNATQGLVSHPGQEQFGLAFDTTPDTLDSAHTPATTNAESLSPLIARNIYANGAGVINTDAQNPTYTAKFAFDRQSDLVPDLLATENSSVVGCTTGKMRYIANIAATTPAGIYAAKVNYLAAPQY